jgi:Carboxypeptidase regulatory-like domain
MRPKLVAFAAMAAALAVAATTGCVKQQIRGRITDCRLSSPVEGADVQLTSRAPDIAWEAVQTGSDGAYSFQVDDPQRALPVTLTAARHGYQSTQKSYSAMPGSADVCMQPFLR